MPPKNIAAYTECGINPPGYISVNEVDGGKIAVTVRESGPSGNTAELRLERPAFLALLHNATSHL